jgi:hypothetical protein
MAKREKLKEALEWLHHAYWIRELILSFGFWGIVVTWAQVHLRIAPGYKWLIIVFLVGVSMYVFAWFSKRKQPAITENQNVAASLLPNSSDRTLSPGVDIKEFFRTAYRTPLEEDVRKNFRTLAAQEEPKDRERFYLNFIGVGLVQAIYDSLWWPMYQSQLMALLEINRNGGIVPIDKIKALYDKAAQKYPKEYAKDTFERWLSYLAKNGLVLNHPSGMVEITIRGKDFLKYLTHWGRELDAKRL